MYIQPFNTVVDRSDSGCIMEVSTMFYICRYCVFTWFSRYIKGTICDLTEILICEFLNEACMVVLKVLDQITFLTTKLTSTFLRF